MATKTAANGAVTASSTKNNGGVGLNTGSSTILTKEESVRDGYARVSAPVSGINTDSALSAGTFATDNQRGVIQRVNSTLAGGVSKTFLQYAADDTDHARAVHKRESTITFPISTAIREGQWNIFSGVFDPAITSTTDNFWSAQDGSGSSSSTDDAAAPTRAVPGEFVYKLGQPSPVSGDYPAKTS